MKKTFGALCMAIGALLIAGALSLFIYNLAEADRAEKFSIQAVSQLKSVISDNENQNVPPVFESGTTTEQRSMAELEIDGYSYIGYLSVPSQSLELPVISQWDYDKLQVAPCRYSGSISEKNLVLIAHNYSSHFGNLDQLEFEDEVRFTDAEGVATYYRVVSIDVVPPASAEEVAAGNSDLALVTCTYSGKTRIVVYCDEVAAH